MRLHRLELQGFGPFAGRETVDFTVLNEAGLFLLDGPTGAGKSTVLAGVCFALYGSVPGDRTPEALASTQSPLGTRPEVLLDFTVGGRRFEVQRWPRYRRPARRRSKDGTGLTEEKAGAVLREQRDGHWHELSVRADEIGQLLRDVLFLDADQFMRVVLLPQGEFATFLRARSAEKETLLRKLFGTGRYDGVEDFLAARHRALEAAVSRDRDQVAASRADLLSCLADGLGERWWEEAEEALDEPTAWTDEDLADQGSAVIGGAVEAAAAARARAAEELAAAQDRLQDLTRRQQDIRAAVEWQERSARHAALADRTAADRRAVELHRAALPVDRRARDAEEAAAALRSGLAALDAARAAAAADEQCRAWGAAGPSSAAGPEAGSARATATVADPLAVVDLFDGLRQRVDRELDRLADRERDAERLRQARDETRRLRESIAALTERGEEAARRRAGLEEAQAALQRRVEELGGPAAAAQGAGEAVEAAAQRFRAAREHEDHRRRLTEAEDALRTTTDEAQSAVDAWHAVVERRLAGAASLLAAELRPGEPCQVCGSAEHPAPAAPGGAEISAEAQESARGRMDELSGRRREAQERVDSARAAAEAHRLEAGGLAPGEAEAALESAREVLRAAERAVEDLAGARAALAANEREQQDQARSAEAAREEAAVARTRLAATEEEATRLERAVEQALDGRGSLADRRDGLETARGLVDAVLEAAHGVLTAQSVCRQAEEALAEHVSASGFGSVEEARAALLDEEDERSLAGRVRDWDGEEAALAALASGEAVVRGRDLVAGEVPCPADEELREAAAAVAEAARVRDEAAARAGGLESLHRQVRRQADVLRDVAGRSAGQVAELEEAEGLLRLVRGQGENALKMTLGSYVLAGRLEEVVASATERLLGMTQGRYELRHDDAARGRGVRGLDITVFDRYTEDERPAGTLSGGETFMASLALALGLADTVQAEAGGVDMDTLFVDEGFGSLDSSSLADVMEVLDGLQADGRAIGVVSHVERMRQDIGYRLQVVKTRQGSHLRVVVPDQP
ncbi:AAA family ATPase [Citricoccus sp. SGAir0253]|uniref:AAA family ATPase n=1 Tax=Citricoccus sp. SGAir0253 TaxID=2567881 RepID=UPI00143D8FA6|nr:SMC family ATPase [Citricoccus sp. SGAir0253]